jgi:hypothetical protein
MSENSYPSSPTVRKFISDVRNDLHSINLDQWIPAKYIHQKGIDVAALFIKREADAMRMQEYPDIWLTVDNVVMEESQLVGATDIPVPSCTSVMKSVKKIPRIFSTRYGYLLNLSSIDFSGDYTQVTPREYNNKKNRKFQNPTRRYFWIYNGYLVVPDSKVQSFTIRAIFANKKEGLEFNGCGNQGCISLLDQEFPAPGHLLSDIKNKTVQEIAGVRERITPSEYPHLDELEKKSPMSKA